MAFYKPEVGDAVRAGIPDEYDYVPALRAHSHPVTIVVGEHDCVDPGGESARTTAGGALNVIVVPEAGHNLWIDQPERFSQVALQAIGGG